MRNIKTAIAGLILLAVAFLALPLGVGSAAATQTAQEEVCYEQVSYQEFQFRKTVTTPAVEEVSHVEYRWDIQTRERITVEIIQKQTRTLEAGTKAVPSKWWVWAPTDTRGPQDYIPNFPNDERGKWVGPKTSGGPSQDTYGTFQQGGGNSSWFHRSEPIPGTGPTWSQWTFWGSPSLVDDGRDRGPLPHNNKTPGTVGYREYRYIVIGTQLVGFTEWSTVGQTDWSLSDTKPSDTELKRYVNKQERTVVDVEAVDPFDTTYYYTGGEPSTSLEDAVWTESNPGEPWEQFNERTSSRQQEVDCPPVTTEPPVTTVPPTTEPPVTTVPPTTQPPVTTTPPTTEPPVVTTTPPQPETTVVVATDIPPVPPTVPPAGLPATGSTTSGIVGTALALLLAGALALALSRRKASNI